VTDTGETRDASGSAWTLSDEHVALRDLVRSFVQQEVIPAENAHAAPDDVHLPDDILDELQTKARQAGLWCVGSPAHHGGGGFSLFERVLIAEEASQCRLGIDLPAAGAFGSDPPSVIFQGTGDQIERYGAPSVSNGRKTFIAISEPSGGSDPARSIQTTARRTSDGWLLNGTKTWISGADEADWGIVFARTGEGRNGISSFIVETSTPGLVATPIPVIRPWWPCELSLTDVLVPEENLLGEEGRGFELAQQWLVHNRVPYAAGVIGVAQAALGIASAYA
jgi:acyl-CoA dehydrogenase